MLSLFFRRHDSGMHSLACDDEARNHYKDPDAIANRSDWLWTVVTYLDGFFRFHGRLQMLFASVDEPIKFPKLFFTMPKGSIHQNTSSERIDSENSYRSKRPSMGGKATASAMRKSQRREAKR